MFDLQFPLIYLYTVNKTFRRLYLNLFYFILIFLYLFYQNNMKKCYLIVNYKL